MKTRSTRDRSDKKPQRGPWDERARVCGWPEDEIAEIAARMVTPFAVHDIRVESGKIAWTVDEVFDFGHRLVDSPRRYVQKRAIRVESFTAVDAPAKRPWCALHGWGCVPTEAGCGFAGEPVIARELCACPAGGRHAYTCELRGAERAICDCGPFKKHRPRCARSGMKTAKVLPFERPAGLTTAAPAKKKASGPKVNPNQTFLSLAAPAQKP